jgi:ATP-dependent helicase YprA (DUF1998 family)
MSNGSNLLDALDRLTQSSARAMVSRARIASPGLNRWMERSLMRPAGSDGALVADPVIEIARSWQAAPEPLGALAPGLLSAELITALDKTAVARMPATRPAYAHQQAAWKATLTDHKSVIVTAGTGAGKTECFLIPILQDCLSHPRPGGGVRAILIYPLNALIESQRERLAAWAEALGGKVRFALFNGNTPETERKAKLRSDKVELRSREKIRECPPEILVTNITMLEYLLLRGADRPILDQSQGMLRWIVLDEAHSYAGSQAAEMALLLRRVRAGFGVGPEDVRLIATSATIGGEERTEEKLADFAAALAGQSPDRVAVIEGRERVTEMPVASADSALELSELAELSVEDLSARVAAHPRVQAMRAKMAEQGLQLAEVAQLLTGDRAQRAQAGALLDHCARAQWQGASLLPWRAHLFHRAQGGVWACPDPGCPHRAAELADEAAGWPFGATWISPRASCECGARIYELVACTDCGTVHLEGLLHSGARPRLDPPDPGEGDDFALDAEPDEEGGSELPTGKGWLAIETQPGGIVGWLAQDGRWFDNASPEGQRAWRLRLIDRERERGCCDRAKWARLCGLHYGPAFLIGSGIAGLLEDLAPPDGAQGLPSGGRRSITFSDSRQGVARLAAKLQQGAERELTRAYLWHAVQEGPAVDSDEIARLSDKIAKMEAAGLGDYAEDDRRRLDAATGSAALPISWRDLVQGLASHNDIQEFAGAIWKGRRIGEDMADDPTKIAEMFLYRELFRRPRVQNNPETLGLLKLTFPKMEEHARLSGPPALLKAVGLDAEAWVGLTQAAMDMAFRQSLAIDMPLWMVPLVAPRFGKLNSIVRTDARKDEMPSNARRWPGAVPEPTRRLTHLANLVYALLGESPQSSISQDRAGEVLQSLWSLITRTVGRDTGAGAWRLDFSGAGVVRLERAFFCPVTRRPYAYSIGGRSQNDPTRAMGAFEMPRLPISNRGGLTREQAAKVAAWCESDADVRALRLRGIWSDLHDRLATFPPYLRAQEHSAQISREVLKRYEEDFAAGRINLLNCSTTMEMGVDLADVRLVVNTNVPPSLANYRQRAGRAGRRGEPWAFTVTFCRDLPLDRRTFAEPKSFLSRPIVAPRVWFESAALVQRHVNAALLSAWFADRGGTSVTGNIGAFLGAGDSAERCIEDDAAADVFLTDLDSTWPETVRATLDDLVRGTALAGYSTTALAARTRLAFHDLVHRWRNEHRALLEAASASADRDAQKALELRARRLKGEFLLGELARRGFTPAYGFPTDVVSFENLSHRPAEIALGASHFKRGTASRPLDQAIREYAPGAEIVIDGLVHCSEGILPAWEAGADASRLEDLRTLWSCPSCRAFDWATLPPQDCPHCGHPLDFKKALRPAGFLGASPAHVGYENLAHVQADPLRISAQGAEWVALPAGSGRMRADPAGRVAVSTSGPQGGGFAICLDCGRAHPMATSDPGIPSTLPAQIQRHYPLLLRKTAQRTRDGLCPGSDAPQRIQRDVHFAQVKQTDVWEWQLPEGATEPAARGLAAALREALTEKLGVEPAEVFPAASPSTGLDGAPVVSAYLHDRAAGGAGLSARMAESEMLVATLDRATKLLQCPDECRRGCPACILRPDLNVRDLVLDRPGALALAITLRQHLDLPDALRLFGPQTRLAGRPATAMVSMALTQGRIHGLDLPD